MAEELQQDIQGTLCQATVETLKAIADDFKLDVAGQKKSTMVCMIFHYMDKELMEKSEENKVLFLKELRERHLKTEAVNVLPGSKDKSEVEKVTPVHEKNEQGTLKSILESTSVFRRQFKIVGQIGQPNEKDKLSYTSLTRQMDAGLKQGYTEQEIVDGVIRAIGGGMVLRSYVETYKDLSLERLRKILRNHYGVKNSTELYQSLASICQGPKETTQDFLMRALDLRQKILFSNNQDQSEDTLVYEAEHIQKLFLRTVETGLQDENVRVKVRSYLKNPEISDEELIFQVNNAVSTENERVRKLRNQNRPPKSGQAAQVTETTVEKSQETILKAIETLKTEVAQVKTQLKDINHENNQPDYRAQTVPESSDQKKRVSPKCSQCKTNGKDKCTHCFICGGENHFAVGCRQKGRDALNSNRLLPRGRK